MAAIPLAISAVGALSSAQASSQQTAATQQAEGMQAQVQRNNATIANWDASDAILQGAQKAQQSMQNTASLVSTQRATMAANGLDLSQGTPANIVASTKYQGELDTNTIQANAARQAWGYANQAVNATNNAEILTSSANQLSSSRSGFTTLLGGAGNVASNWYGLNKQGAFN
jgi:hypothetical protein